MLKKIIPEQHRDLNLKFFDALDDVMTTTRDMIHSGHALISHPLAGSVKPMENPYRTIILSEETGPLDYESLRILENAMSQVNAFKQSYDPSNCPEFLLSDYQLIDSSLIDSAMKSLKITI